MRRVKKVDAFGREYFEIVKRKYTKWKVLKKRPIDNTITENYILPNENGLQKKEKEIKNTYERDSSNRESN